MQFRGRTVSESRFFPRGLHASFGTRFICIPSEGLREISAGPRINITAAIPGDNDFSYLPCFGDGGRAPTASSLLYVSDILTVGEHKCYVTKLIGRTNGEKL